MPDSYLPPPGEPLPAEEVRVPKARDTLRLLEPGKQPFVRLIECRRAEEPIPADVLVFEVEVGLAQRKIHDVRRWERVAVLFWEGDVASPEVLALRADFPLVPHLNLTAVFRSFDTGGGSRSGRSSRRHPEA